MSSRKRKQYHHKRARPATGHARFLLNLSFRLIRDVVRERDLLQLTTPNDDLGQLHSYREQLMGFYRELAQGKRDPRVVLGMKGRTGRPGKSEVHAQIGAAIWAAYFKVKRDQPSSRRPFMDALAMLRAEHPEWKRYSDASIRRYKNRFADEYGRPPMSEEEMLLGLEDVPPG